MSNKLDVLLVDDSPSESELFKAVAEDCADAIRMVPVRGGSEALSYLRRQNGYHSAPKPDLVLLDVNMPAMNGFEVLKEVRRDPILRPQPILLLSSSAEAREVHQAYDLGANGYLHKPHSVEAFCAMLHKLQRFWLEVAKLPP